MPGMGLPGVQPMYGMTYWIRDGNEVSAEYYDLNSGLVDAIADMLPTLRDETRRRAIVAAQEGVRVAEKKLADLVGQGG